jgi:hypothetical protein
MSANLDDQLLAAGVSRDEIDAMTHREKRDLLQAFANSSQQQRQSSDDDEFQRVHALSLSESQPSSETLPPAIISIDCPRGLVTDEIAAASAGHANVPALERSRRELVSGLVRFPSLQRPSYSAEIQKLSRALPAPPVASGVRVALLLPSGQRIARSFARGQRAEDVYMWCAAADAMVKDFIRPGDFVIVAGDGRELDPAASIGQQVEGERVLLNVRVLPIED